VRKMRPSSPTIHPSRSVGKHEPKRFCRTSPRSTGSALATAAQATTSGATRNFMRTPPECTCTPRADTSDCTARSASGLYPCPGRSVNGVPLMTTPMQHDPRQFSRLPTRCGYSTRGARPGQDATLCFLRVAEREGWSPSLNSKHVLDLEADVVPVAHSAELLRGDRGDGGVVHREAER